jgi:hypothetical protein
MQPLPETIDTWKWKYPVIGIQPAKVSHA